MRRRPLEFWWIATYCLVRGALVFGGLSAFAGDRERALVSLYATSLITVSGLLLAFQWWGRRLGLVVLGVEAVEMACRMAEGVEIGAGLGTGAALSFASCIWLSLYLQRPSTAKLFPGSGKFETDAAGAEFELFSIFDLTTALAAGGLARQLGGSVWLSIAAGFASYLLYCTFVEEWLHQWWDSYFAQVEPGFPEFEARGWRSACCALARNDLAGARACFKQLHLDGQLHPAGRLF